MNSRSTPTSPVRTSRSRGTDSYDSLEPLLTRLAVLDAADPRRKPLRDELINRCLPLAENIARKYVGRGENFEDLLQTARVGMMLAIDRFDPQYGTPFLSFAIPTILGEVRRHFRDHTWAVRVPRRLKEIQLRLGSAIEVLCQRLGRMPTAGEIAAELEVGLDEVTQALIARNGYRSSSIEACFEGDYESPTLLDLLGAEQPEFGTVVDRMAVKPLIEALPERDRQVLNMRFFDSQSQIRIAESFGVSQMQVSRTLSRTLSSLREQALRD